VRFVRAHFLALLSARRSESTLRGQRSENKAIAAVRWPNGFVCPACGGVKGWELSGKRFTCECAECGRQTSVTAGTVMHRSKLPLTTWFMALHFVSSHSNGISALQLQAQLGLGSYKTAWLMLHKLRRTMVDPDRSQLNRSGRGRRD
jgi:hypothetical protein